MESKQSLLEIAQRQLAEAEAEFARDPTDKSAQWVQRARSLVRSEQEREQKHGGPIRPPDSN
jgi:hypothetical protein